VVDVVRHDDTQVVLLTLKKPLPSSVAQDSVGKSWMAGGADGSHINSSTMSIPNDRTWWHGTTIDSFGGILRDSLQPSSTAKYKAVYSFTGWESCQAFGGHVYFAFRSFGMVTCLDKALNVPREFPEGLIGFFNSTRKRQWLHHPANVQLTYARVEFNTLCTFLSETLANIPGEHSYSGDLHQALMNVAGLVVPTYDDEHKLEHEYDFDGPHVLPRSAPTWGPYDDSKLESAYGIGYTMLFKEPKKSDSDKKEKSGADKNTLEWTKASKETLQKLEERRTPQKCFEALWNLDRPPSFRNEKGKAGKKVEPGSAATVFVAESVDSSTEVSHASVTSSAAEVSSASGSSSSASKSVHFAQAVVCSRNSSTLTPGPHSRHI
jgi:hypothetical protein